MSCVFRLTNGEGYSYLPDMEIKDIIKRAGGPTKVARALGISRPSVCGWKQVPPNRMKRLSEVTGIPLHEMVPDDDKSPLLADPAPQSQEAA